MHASNRCLPCVHVDRARQLSETSECEECRIVWVYVCACPKPHSVHTEQYLMRKQQANVCCVKKRTLFYMYAFHTYYAAYGFEFLLQSFAWPLCNRFLFSYWFERCCMFFCMVLNEYAIFCRHHDYLVNSINVRIMSRIDTKHPYATM